MTDLTNGGEQHRTGSDDNTNVMNQYTADQCQVVVTTILEYTEVFVWGEDKYGQLGIDSQLQANPSTDASALKGSVVRYKRPDFIPVPRSCSFNIVIKQVDCGEHHSGILTAQGHLYMMGSNRVGQLGVNSVPTVRH